MTRSIADYLQTRTAHPLSYSSDGSTLLVGSNLPGTVQLFTVPAGGGEMTQVTDLPEPVTGRFLPGSSDVLVAVDSGGNERLQLHRMTFDARQLTPLVVDPDHIHRPGGVTRDGRLLAYTCNRRTGTDFDVWVRDLVTGDERLVFSPGGWCAAGAFSPDGRLLGVLRLSEKPGDNDLHLVDVDTGAALHVTPHRGIAAYSGPSWLPDGSGFFFTTDESRELAAVARFDVAAEGWEIVLETPWDASCAVDWAGRSLLVATNADGTTEASLHDPITMERRGSVPLLGGGVAAAWTFSADGRRLAWHETSATEPGDVWSLDLDAGLDPDAVVRLTDCPKAVPPSTMVAPELHRFSSFDGEQVPVFVYRPPQPAADPPPVVALIHGGPESQFVPSFNPVVQYLVAHGYGVVAPNVRGSTGYGKRWEHLDDVERRLDAVRDLAGLHDWLAEAGFDPARAVLYGGSYGGYMVLAGLAFQPERWAAGVDIVGISSLVTFLENTAAWRRRFREREYGSLERHHDLLVEASPITHVDRMQAPLFIIHGANDPRVPVGEAEQIHEVLTEKGIPCELVVYHDEGHGLAKLSNRLDAYPRALAFLDDVLGLA